MSNLFDRYPKLKIVSAESGIGWVPFILEAMEYQLDEMVTDRRRGRPTRAPPDRVLPRPHLRDVLVRAASAPAKLIEDIGVNNVLVETDMPHPTCLYPGAREHFARVLGDLDAARPPPGPAGQRRRALPHRARLTSLHRARRSCPRFVCPTRSTSSQGSARTPPV